MNFTGWAINHGQKSKRALGKACQKWSKRQGDGQVTQDFHRTAGQRRGREKKEVVKRLSE